MRTIRLYSITSETVGQDFNLNDYPELRLYQEYSQRKEIKRLNIEQYFRGVGRDYKDYTKLIYGPVFGMDDPRNGFIYEHQVSEELVIVDEEDIPITYEACDVLKADLNGLCKVDIDIPNGIITSYQEMLALCNKQHYIDLIRDEWIPNRSFLIVE